MYARDSTHTHTSQEFKKAVRSSSPEELNEMLIQLMKRWHQIYEARKYEIAERKTYTAPDSDSHEKWSDEKDMTRIINVQSKKSLKSCLHKLVESEDETCAKLLKIAVFVWRTEGFLDLQVRDMDRFTALDIASKES